MGTEWIRVGTVGSEARGTGGAAGSGSTPHGGILPPPVAPGVGGTQPGRPVGLDGTHGRRVQT